MQIKKKIRFSIFLKLIILIIIFIVLVNLSAGFIIRSVIDRGPFHHPAKISYAFNDYFIKDVGNPPDTNKANSILSRLGTNVRFETSKSRWTSSNDIPGIIELSEEKDFEPDKTMFTVRKRKQFYDVMKTEDGYIIFAPPPFPGDDLNIENAIFPLIICITLLAALLYFSLRWIFGPIKKLSEAVSQISGGNFNTSIDINRNDELGNLAGRIDEMKTNISGMIKSKESLLIDVSHELRSPLTRIKLANEFVENEKIKIKIRDDIKEMELMITGLLETYRLDTAAGKLNIEKVELVKFISGIITKSGNESLNLRSDFEKKDVRLDKEKMGIALSNIIDNAVKYSDGKPVDISLQSGQNSKNEIIISIKDYGRGIEQEEISKIFEPFYRIDKSRDKKISGFGLGLSIVKKILDLHNADIIVL
ncbi:MAG: HAMP domain-containing sensor histidine kinase, partial [bacterium]